MSTFTCCWKDRAMPVNEKPLASGYLLNIVITLIIWWIRSDIKREDNNYSLIDLESGEWFEKMSIYYIRKLLDNWNKNTRYKDNEYVEILIQ